MTINFTKQELESLKSILFLWNEAYNDTEIKILEKKIDGMIGNSCPECKGEVRIDEMCNGQKGCCVYTCSNCK